MKKLTVLLLAAALLCTCFVLAACSEDGADTSSATETSSTAGTSSEQGTSSAAESSEEASSEEASSEEPAPPEPQVFWVTHYNDDQPEGAGVIFTETDTAGDWSTHVAFQPVEGEDNVWEIVAISFGVGTGAGQKLDVPEGGFVYAVNTGNDWPQLVDDPANAENDWIQSMRGSPDYTTAVCSNLGGVVMATWKVGDKFQLDGITYDDMLEEIVPTDTPDVQWWEDGDYDSGHYNCTATFLPVA